LRRAGDQRTRSSVERRVEACLVSVPYSVHGAAAYANVEQRGRLIGVVVPAVVAHLAVTPLDRTRACVQRQGRVGPSIAAGTPGRREGRRRVAGGDIDRAGPRV